MQDTNEKLGSSLLEDVAEVKKAKFVQLVEALVRLRELQYESSIGESVIVRAKKIIAQNLPSNLVRAAAVFVDQSYGFPPDRGSFEPPLWITAKKLLSQSERSLLSFPFEAVYPFEEKDVVVLLKDLPEHGLHAGMAGIIRELPPEGGSTYMIEFGEPEESRTIVVDVAGEIIRKPRPGDLLENYRL